MQTKQLESMPEMKDLTVTFDTLVVDLRQRIFDRLKRLDDDEADARSEAAAAGVVASAVVLPSASSSASSRGTYAIY